MQAGVGYRNDVTNGVPTGSQPQGAYMVTSGTHVDDLCCFDFGNAETTNTDTGNGHMDAINFGTECWFTPCTGSGPWVQADLENGLFMGGNGSDTGNVGNASKFVTAIMNNNGTTDYTIADANAQSGGVHVEYSGPLPDIGGYTPMNTEGSILLGTGGDDSNGSDGSFFEGVVTAGYPSAGTDSAVQANIVAAGYQAVTPAFPAAGTDYTITNVNSAHRGPAGRLRHRQRHRHRAVDAPAAPTCQQWTFTSAGNGHYTITNVASGTVLDSVTAGVRRHADRPVVVARQRLPGVGRDRGRQPLHDQQRRQRHGPRRGGLRGRQRHRRPPVGAARQRLPAVGHRARHALTGALSAEPAVSLMPSVRHGGRHRARRSEVEPGTVR